MILFEKKKVEMVDTKCKYCGIWDRLDNFHSHENCLYLYNASDVNTSLYTTKNRFVKIALATVQLYYERPLFKEIADKIVPKQRKIIIKFNERVKKIEDENSWRVLKKEGLI